MDIQTQQLIIIILGIIGLAGILKGNTDMVYIIIAGLLGFFSQKTMNDKQNEILTQTIQEQQTEGLKE